MNPQYNIQNAKLCEAHFHARNMMIRDTVAYLLPSVSFLETKCKSAKK